MKIFNAIKKINSDAKVAIRGSDIDTCEIEWLDGTVEISKEDIKAMIPTVEQEEADAITKKATDKTSAQNKLKALGLTNDEIEAL